MTQFIAIMGSKDRVGASHFSCQLATRFQKEGKRVLLCDADADFPGDLQIVSGAKNPWRSLGDLGHLPKPVEFPVLSGFLKGLQDVACLQLAADRGPIPWESFRSVASFFEVVVADLGSRFHPVANPFLTLADFLLFVLNADPLLAEETRRKCEALSRAYFPFQQLGWVAWRWDADSFLTPQAVSEFLKIPCYGEDVGKCLLMLETKGNAKEDKRTFLPEMLPRRSAVAGVAAVSAEEAPLLASPLEEKCHLKLRLIQNIQEKMETRGLKAEAREEGLREKVHKIVLEVLEECRDEMAPDVERPLLALELLDDLLGLGPLERLLKHPRYGEILVNGTDFIYVEEAGRLKKTPLHFLNREALEKAIERMLLPVGRRVDEASPMVDARLSCGSRVNIITPPLALEGPIVSIRRFAQRALMPADLVRLGTADESLMRFLETAVRERLNILVSGGTGSGKTTLLNVLSSFIPEEERIITIEDAAELQLAQPHMVRLEARPANIEGKGAVTIRDLVRNALRMRPDRIVVGECRGAEALDMLQAMNTGHDGSLTTLHANSPRDALARLETLVMFAGMELPSKAIRDQIASAIDLVVQIARLKTGERKILSVARVAGMEGDVFTLEKIV